LQVWQWLFLLGCLCICKGGVIGAVFGQSSSKGKKVPADEEYDDEEYDEETGLVEE
jgi:hypothetical protein